MYNRSMETKMWYKQNLEDTVHYICMTDQVPHVLFTQGTKVGSWLGTETGTKEEKEMDEQRARYTPNAPSAGQLTFAKTELRSKTCLRLSSVPQGLQYS